MNGDEQQDPKRARVEPAGQWSTNPRFLQAMLATRVDRFFTPGDVIFVADRSNKVIDVWKGLVEKNFLAVPVLQQTEHRYYGFLVLSDIVRELVRRFSQERLRNEEAFWEQLDETRAFGDMLVKDIIKHPLSHKNPFHPVRTGYSLLFALELMAREDELHRVPIVDAERNLVNLITQSKVVDYVAQHRDLLGDKAMKPLKACKELFKPVVAVTLDTIAIDAFDRMIDKGVFGLAVLDDAGRLVDNLSMRDLKVVGSTLSRFWRFYQTVRRFLDELKTESSYSRVKSVVAVTEDNTIGDVLERLSTNHIHRVFIVDSMTSMKPVGVVALKDVLLQIISD